MASISSSYFLLVTLILCLQLYQAQSQAGYCRDSSSLVGRLPPSKDPITRPAIMNNNNFNCSTLVTVHATGSLGTAILSRMALIASARSRNITYIHTPFFDLDHMRDREKTFEHFINIGDGEIDVRALGQVHLITQMGPQFEALSHTRGECIENLEMACPFLYACTTPSSCFYDTLTLSKFHFESLLPMFRQRYHRSKKVESERPPWRKIASHELSVAIHLQPAYFSKQHERYVRHEKYLEVMERIRHEEAVEGKRVKFHVFTQGSDYGEFHMFNSSDVEVHVQRVTTPRLAKQGAESDLRFAFNSMVNADVLVVTKTALSYAAGCLSEGKVYHIPHPQYPTLTGWIPV